MNPKLIEIGRKAISHCRQPRGIFSNSNRAEYSIFLCGASQQSNKSLRPRLRNAIESRSSRMRYRIFFPEELFSNVLHSHEKHSLLRLENLLASCVCSVVIVLESAGALTELGAFTNHPTLKQKLTIVVDQKHKGDRSFINLGPLRELQTNDRWSVIFHDLASPDVDSLAVTICERTRKLDKQHQSTQELINPIDGLRTYLGLVYIFAPIHRLDLVNLAKLLADDPSVVEFAASTAIDYLVRTGHITQGIDGLSTTSAGHDSLFERQPGLSNQIPVDRRGFTLLRLSAMNIRLRRYHKRRGEGA